MAKSNVAKKFGIKTAEPIYQARRKCPSIIVVSSEFEVYRDYSDKLYKLFLEYSTRDDIRQCENKKNNIVL